MDAEEASSEKEGELEKLLEGRESPAAESDKLDRERGIQYGLTYGTWKNQTHKGEIRLPETRDKEEEEWEQAGKKAHISKHKIDKPWGRTAWSL